MAQDLMKKNVDLKIEIPRQDSKTLLASESKEDRIEDITIGEILGGF